mmetsp:Transcript_37300/g.66534  ORF Transcript_37300/g.66534 Transcript_37300/m.66534 type:complete len:88 (+) Transcript_37300:220-483(+)
MRLCTAVDTLKWHLQPHTGVPGCTSCATLQSADLDGQSSPNVPYFYPVAALQGRISCQEWPTIDHLLPTMADASRLDLIRMEAFGLG